MNNIAIALIIIGIIQITGGFILGIATMEILWFWLGIITGIILFGFAEMINLPQQNRDIAKEQLGVLKGQFLLEDESIEEDNKSQEKEDDGYDELRKELKEQGHDYDYIEATVAIRKRLGKH